MGQEVLNKPFQATTTAAYEIAPTKPVLLDIDLNFIDNMLIISPPKEQVVESEERQTEQGDYLEFTDLDVEGRRKILLQYRKDQLIKEYPILSQVPQDEESFATAVGGLIGTLFDPTTLTPVGTGLKSLGAVSAVLSGSYNLADQYANKGEVDPAELAAMTAAGGGRLRACIIGASRGRGFRARRRQVPAPGREDDAVRRGGIARSIPGVRTSSNAA
mgnify:CR=1 FL=1